MPFVIYFRIDKWTESMLSITSSQESLQHVKSNFQRQTKKKKSTFP